MLLNNLLPFALLLVPTWAASLARQSEDSQSCVDLLPDFSGIPDKTSSGKLMLFANVQVAEGKVARAEELMSNLDAVVRSGAEPGSLTHRSVRILDQNGNPSRNYTVIEEFTDKEALITHLTSPTGCVFLREAPDLFVSQSLVIVDEFGN